METALRLAIIGAGGFVGAILRFLVSGWLQNKSGQFFFPFGTMGVNLIGCFCIGFCTMLVETKSFFSVELRSFLFVGVLGAFTTFSTFGNDTLMLIRGGRFDLAALNAVVQVVVGLVMVCLGRVVGGGFLK
ncbi:MAG: fluoride efflux transporter CrcB [Desulfobulbus propionicus]|nr:MAG: fluoride efflux transporter CrcB [Desulfobulbus propionicus]